LKFEVEGMEEDKLYDLIIIGGGPTGINVGVEAKKSGGSAPY